MDYTSELICCVLTGDKESFDILLEKGADPNSCLPNGKPLVNYAIEFGENYMAKKLVKKGANFSSYIVSCYNNFTSFLELISGEHCDKSLVKLLVKICPNIKNYNIKKYIDEYYGGQLLKNSPVLYTLFYDKVPNNILFTLSFVRYLFSHNLDPNLKNYDNFTILMYMCMNGYGDIVLLLFDRNVDVNIRDNKNKTALMYACKHGHKEIVHMLINRGSDVNIRDNKNVSAFMHACKYGRTKIANVLINHSSNIKIPDINYIRKYNLDFVMSNGVILGMKKFIHKFYYFLRYFDNNCDFIFPIEIRHVIIEYGFNIIKHRYNNS